MNITHSTLARVILLVGMSVCLSGSSPQVVNSVQLRLEPVADSGSETHSPRVRIWIQNAGAVPVYVLPYFDSEDSLTIEGPHPRNVVIFSARAANGEASKHVGEAATEEHADYVLPRFSDLLPLANNAFLGTEIDLRRGPFARSFPVKGRYVIEATFESNAGDFFRRAGADRDVSESDLSRVFNGKLTSNAITMEVE